MTRSRTVSIFIIAVVLEVIKFLIITLMPTSVLRIPSVEVLFIVFYYVTMLPVVLLFGVELGRPDTLLGKVGIISLDVCWNILLLYLIILSWRGLKAIKRDW